MAVDHCKLHQVRTQLQLLCQIWYICYRKLTRTLFHDGQPLIWQIGSFPFLSEKRIWNSLHFLGTDLCTHLQSCPGPRCFFSLLSEHSSKKTKTSWKCYKCYIPPLMERVCITLLVKPWIPAELLLEFDRNLVTRVGDNKVPTSDSPEPSCSSRGAICPLNFPFYVSFGRISTPESWSSYKACSVQQKGEV